MRYGPWRLMSRDGGAADHLKTKNKHKANPKTKGQGPVRREGEGGDKKQKKKKRRRKKERKKKKEKFSPSLWHHVSAVNKL
jgi:hypothetical protein